MTTTETTAALATTGLSHRYGDRLALDNVSLEIAPGSQCALLGPNGSGKTTLFRIATTLLRATSGQVRVCGHDVTQAPDQVRSHIGTIFQQPCLDRDLSVEENLRCHGALYGLKSERLAERIEAVLRLTNIVNRRGDRVGSLSGGLARRADIARGLLHSPPVLFLDEPAAALDPSARMALRDLLAELASNGTTVIRTTHLLEEAATCKQVILLHEGKVVAMGSPDELTASVATDVVVLTSADPDVTRAKLPAELHDQCVTVGRSIYVLLKDPERSPADLIGQWLPYADEVALRKPTLADVFLVHTGHALTSSEG